jgi:hypothetical protein
MNEWFPEVTNCTAFSIDVIFRVIGMSPRISLYESDCPNDINSPGYENMSSALERCFVGWASCVMLQVWHKHTHVLLIVIIGKGGSTRNDNLKR